MRFVIMLERLPRFFAAVNPSGLGMVWMPHCCFHECYSVTLRLALRVLPFIGHSTLKYVSGLPGSMKRCRHSSHWKPRSAMREWRSTAPIRLILFRAAPLWPPCSATPTSSIQRERTRSESPLSRLTGPVRASSWFLSQPLCRYVPVSSRYSGFSLKQQRIRAWSRKTRLYACPRMNISVCLRRTSGMIIRGARDKCD